MIIKIESTTKIVEINGIKTRVWEGETSTGIKIHCYIALIAMPDTNPEKEAEFAKDLKRLKDPSPEIEAIPLRLIL